MRDRKVIASVAKILRSTWSVSLKVQHFQLLYHLSKKRFYNGNLKICTITGRIVWKTTRCLLSIGLNYFVFYHIHLKMFLLNIIPPKITQIISKQLSVNYHHKADTSKSINGKLPTPRRPSPVLCPWYQRIISNTMGSNYVYFLASNTTD